MDEMKCNQCGKLLPSADALEQHNKAKHPAKDKSAPAPKIKTSHIAYAAIVVALLGGGYYLYSLPSMPGQYDDFAKCITDSGAKFYGAFWCPHCANQKAAFGASAKYLPYIECSTSDRSGQTQACIDANITGYPTWQFPDGSRVSGEVGMEELAGRTGCPIYSK